MGGIDGVENRLVLLVELVQSKVDGGLKELDRNYYPTSGKTQSDLLIDLFSRKGKPAIPQRGRDELSSGTILQLTDMLRSIILRSKSRICG